MRLISVRAPGGDDALGIVAASTWMPAAALVPGGPTSMGELLAAGSSGLDDPKDVVERRLRNPCRVEQLAAVS